MKLCGRLTSVKMRLTWVISKLQSPMAMDVMLSQQHTIAIGPADIDRRLSSELAASFSKTAGPMATVPYPGKRPQVS